MASANEIKLRAQEINANRILTTELSEFNALVPWDKKNPLASPLIPQRYTNENRVVDYTEVQSATVFDPARFLDGSITDFKLDTSDVSVIDHAFLRFNITNSTGAAVTLPPTSFWFHKIEILNGESNALTNVHDLENWMALCMMDRTAFENMNAQFGTTDAYSTAGVTIANNATTDLSLPIFTLFSPVRLHLAGLNKGLIIRFHAKPSAMNLIAGTHPTVNRASLLLGGFDEAQVKRSQRTALYRSPRIKFFPFHSWNQHSSAPTLTAGISMPIKLTGFDGIYAALFVCVRALPVTNANQGTLIPLQACTVKDEHGTILCGNHEKNAALNKLILSVQAHSLSPKFVNYTMIPFSSTVIQDFQHGQSHGYQVFGGKNEILNVTTATGVATGQYEVLVLGLRADSLRVQGGNAESRK